MNEFLALTLEKFPYLSILFYLCIPSLIFSSWCIICNYKNNIKVINICAIIVFCISVLLFSMWGFFIVDQENYKIKKEQLIYEQHINNFDTSALIGTQVIKTYKTTDDFHAYQNTGLKAGYKIISVNLNDKNTVEVIFEKIK